MLHIELKTNQHILTSERLSHFIWNL